VSEKTLREKTKRGEVPGQRVGRGWRFSKRALEKWLGAAPDDGAGVVSEPPQLYLPSATSAGKQKAGFRDTAFTKNRDEPVHRWVPWIAGFSAGFVGEILDRELAAKPELSLLDPFAGVGTTLVEGLARNCDVAGFEINPYAALASSVKLDALDRDADEVREAAQRLDRAFRRRRLGKRAEPSSQPPAGFRTRDRFLSPAVERLGPDSVDVLITSPPYLNNYHYVRNTRPQMFWLDFVAESGELRELETTSFGKFWQTVRAGDPVELAFGYPELEERLALLASLHPEKGAYGGSGWANYAATYFNDCARFCDVTAQVMRPGGLVVVVIGNNILQSIEFRTDEYFARIAERYGFEVRGMHLVRKKRTGSSIVNSSVRVGVTKKRVELYETAVELRMDAKS
jgi:excisionase family DNA binding protein